MVYVSMMLRLVFNIQFFLLSLFHFHQMSTTNENDDKQNQSQNQSR